MVDFGGVLMTCVMVGVAVCALMAANGFKGRPDTVGTPTVLGLD